MDPDSRGKRGVVYLREENNPGFGKNKKSGGNLLAKLHFVQFGVEPRFSQQLVMGADLADLAFVEDDDLVGFADGG